MIVAGAVHVTLGGMGRARHLGIQGKGGGARSPVPNPDLFHDASLSYSHLDYPLMVPFLTAGASAAMGTVDDQTGKLVSPFLDVLLVPMVIFNAMETAASAGGMS